MLKKKNCIKHYNYEAIIILLKLEKIFYVIIQRIILLLVFKDKSFFLKLK